MLMKNRIPFSVVNGLFILLVAVSSSAEENRYIEDFSTTLYKDSVNTTAEWDTVEERLKLGQFQPIMVGGCDTPGYANAVVVTGDYAFVSDNAGGLQVIDISDPANPTILGAVYTQDEAKGLAIAGDRLFVADFLAGLQVIDVSNPALPALLGSYDTPGQANGVVVAGDCCFVADGSSGLLVIDISDPATPALLGSYNTPNSAKAVAVAGDCAFVADYSSGLQVIDISDPSSPTLLGSYDTSGYAHSVTIAGDYAFVADNDGELQVIDISDPANPTLLGTVETPSYAKGVTISGDYAYVADYTSGLLVIDITNPATPVLLQTCNTPGYAWDVVIAGDHAYVADYGSGLQVINIADSVSPDTYGSCITPGPQHKVSISGDHALVACGTSGLQIIDISDPVNPTILGEYDTPGIAEDVAVSGDYAYVADYMSGLQVIDITDPSNPTLLGNWDDTSDYAYGVALAGDCAYLADGDFLHVIDISDPANPVLLAEYNTFYTKDVAISGNFAYVTDIGSGLLVLDISNPAIPVLLGSCPSVNCPEGVVVAGNHAFVADEAWGLSVVDISDPTNPILLTTLDTTGLAMDITVSGDHAFLVDGYSGLHIIDISDPTDPLILDTKVTPGFAQAVSVSGDYVFVGGSSHDLRVIMVYQGRYDLDADVGRSLFVDDADDSILRARLTSTQNESVDWELSADGGMNWQDFFPGEDWSTMTVPGTDLLWRSTLSLLDPATGPEVQNLQIEWLVNEAVLSGIYDVPNDQGGWGRLHFTRSGLDFADEIEYPITEYFVFRRIDDQALKAATNGIDFSGPSGLPGGWHSNLTKVAGREVLVSSCQAAGPPPGIWEVVGSVPAHQDDEYICLVPTLADSSETLQYTVYCLSAETTTPSVFYFSAPDSGYSVDNLAPSVPENLILDNGVLVWDESADQDFNYFRVYGSISSLFDESSAIIGNTTDTSFNISGQPFSFFHLTAIDFAGNESLAAGTGDVSDVPGPSQNRTALIGNFPNPFNPSTVILYELEGDVGIRLQVFDVAGRVVRTLENGSIGSAGRNEAHWDGRDNSGKSVSAGIYFFRLEAGSYSETKRMVLVK